MQTFTLSEIIEAFAKMDSVDPEKRDSYGKDLRNLVQRNLLPPSGASGQVFKYTLPRALTIRIAQVLSRMGVNRAIITHACQSMINGHNGGRALEDSFVSTCANADGVMSLVLSMPSSHVIQTHVSFSMAGAPYKNHPYISVPVSFPLFELSEYLGVRELVVGSGITIADWCVLSDDLTIGGKRIPPVPAGVKLNFQTPSRPEAYK